MQCRHDATSWQHGRAMPCTIPTWLANITPKSCQSRAQLWYVSSSCLACHPGPTFAACRAKAIAIRRHVPEHVHVLFACRRSLAKHSTVQARNLRCTGLCTLPLVVDVRVHLTTLLLFRHNHSLVEELTPSIYQRSVGLPYTYVHMCQLLLCCLILSLYQDGSWTTVILHRRPGARELVESASLFDAEAF